MISLAEIGFAAGFYEGEGSFIGTDRKTPYVSITQKDIEPLEKLQKKFGGKIAKYGNYYYWRLMGAEGRGFILTIFTFLSARRRAQILKFKDSFFNTDKCPSGHIYEEGSFDIIDTGTRSYRRCLQCAVTNTLKNGKKSDPDLRKYVEYLIKKNGVK